jgi:hypothetical protein
MGLDPAAKSQKNSTQSGGRAVPSIGMRASSLILASWALFIAAVAIVAGQPRPGAAPALEAPRVSFNRDIRPILSENCYHCHGPDGGDRKADLRLDQQEGLFAGREGGPAVAPGKPAASLIYRRMIAEDEDELMPPPWSHKVLSAEQKDLVKRWIEEGAAWEPHWAFAAPRRPPLPEVVRKGWTKNPIDHFILARLEESGLPPAAEADRRTLARRAALDITGLPPAPEDLEAFLADKSADAYESYVDRLLASPHYGEHRARYWLDAARYADTHGLHFDNYREIWPYRDWVIGAFNQNLPFDQFTIEQLAGDMLAGPTMDQRIATGFNRCNITTNEGGVINAEVEAMYAADRVQTTATVWLALTMECAACHDHKFDPLSQKEFYQLAAFFRNTTQPVLDGNVPDTAPVMVVPAQAERQRWLDLQKRTAELDQRRQQRTRELDEALGAWLAGPEARRLRQPLGDDDQRLTIPLDEGQRDTVQVLGRNNQVLALPPGASWGEGPNKDKALVLGPGAGLEVEQVRGFSSERPFTFAAWVLAPPKDGSFAVASMLDPSSTEPASGVVLEINNRVPALRFLGRSAKQSLAIQGGPLRLQNGKWNHLLVTYDGGGRAQGVAIYLNGKPHFSGPMDDKLLAGGISNDGPLLLGFNGQHDLNGGGLQDVHIFTRALRSDEAAAVWRWHKTRPLLEAGGELGKTERQDLALLHAVRFDPAFRDASAKLAVAETDVRLIRQRSPVTHVMQEKPDSKPKAHVLFRGQYDQPREEVGPATPGVLHPWPADVPANRLGLARWLVDPANPLTARVTINRLWQEVFGTGLVRTAEDFGLTGDHPSHPELLDWLAVEFRECGWDIKAMVRLMVTSAAYRQAAAVTGQNLAQDPDNRLLSRGPRFRMDGEALRDFALASSGLLVREIGGASVRPYQPPGVWEAVAMHGSDTRSYRQDTGSKLYRRSLYTFWKRSAPPASMEIFNAPSRENCTVRRDRTNTPLQALVTMNDPQWVEAARHLAQRAMLEAGEAFDARLDYISTRALARKFEPAEREICRRSLQQFVSAYQADAEAANKLVAVGESKADPKAAPVELAAWTMLASQIMNLDEALTK